MYLHIDDAIVGHLLQRGVVGFIHVVNISSKKSEILVTHWNNVVVIIRVDHISIHNYIMG